MLGHPSTKQFLKIVESNLLPNCPIMTVGINAAEDIFGTSVAALYLPWSRYGSALTYDRDTARSNYSHFYKYVSRSKRFISVSNLK
jgi:hypothetical protein